MEYFDAYEEVFAAIERFADEHGKAPQRINVSPALYRWLLEMKHEAVTLQLEESGDMNVLNTRFGPIPFVIDELLTPYEVMPE